MISVIFFYMQSNIKCTGLHPTDKLTKDYSIEHFIDTIDEIKINKENFYFNAMKTLKNTKFEHISSSFNKVVKFYITNALVKALLQNYHLQLKNAKFNFLSLNIIPYSLTDQLNLVKFIIKLYFKLKSNLKIKTCDVDCSQISRPDFFFNVKYDVLLTKLRKLKGSNFILIENSLANFDQISIFTQIILLINQKNKLNLNDTNVFFSFELIHNETNMFKSTNCVASTLKNLIKKEHLFTLKLSTIYFDENKENNVANQNEKKIGEHYEFEKNDKKFQKVSDYTCSISKNKKFTIITFCDITITNGIRRTDSLYNLYSIKNDEEIKKYEISFNEFSMSFKLVFFVQTTKYNDYHIDKGSRNFMIISVSIYYNYKHNYKLFGRFSYIIDKSNVNPSEIKNRHHAIVKVINDQIKYKTFKKQLIDYLSADFINLADFFQTQKLFLNYIDHMYWAQTKSYFMFNKCVYKFLNKKRLENLVCKIKEISKDNTEITFFQAEVIDSQALIPRKYDDKIFNLVRIKKAIDFEQICDDYLTSIDALIISFATRTTQNTRYYMVLPYNAYEYLTKMAHVYEQIDRFLASDASINKNISDFAAYLFLKRLFMNFLLTSKGKITLSQMNLVDINKLVCEKRIELYIILTNVHREFYLTTQAKLSKARLSKWLQGLMHENLIYDDPIYKYLQSIAIQKKDFNILFNSIKSVLKTFLVQYDSNEPFEINNGLFTWFFDCCSIFKKEKNKNTVLQYFNLYFNSANII